MQTTRNATIAAIVMLIAGAIFALQHPLKLKQKGELINTGCSGTVVGGGGGGSGTIINGSTILYGTTSGAEVLEINNTGTTVFDKSMSSRFGWPLHDGLWSLNAASK